MALGGSVLGVFDPTNVVLHALAELGVLILLFEIGLHTDLRGLAKVGSTAVTVGLVGVVLPFGGRIAVTRALGVELMPRSCSELRSPRPRSASTLVCSPISGDCGRRRARS